jgi:lipid II:glycine glycyltransferase (peptidoglycan interpeptide bridge formation enzyme)
MYFIVSKLLQYYTEIIKDDVLYSRIYPLNDITQIIPSIKENGYEYEGWQNFLIDLKQSKEELWSHLKRDKKRAITKAKNKGVEIQEIIEKSLLSDFYDLVGETYTTRKIRLEDINFFEGIFDVLVRQKKAKFFLAKHEEEYIATRLVLTYKGVIYDWHAGSDKKFLSLYPNDLIVWHILKWGSENGFHTFDFGGAGKPDDSSGWAEFKRRFGGKLVNYGSYTKIHQPKKLWFIEKGFKVYKKLLLR